MKNLKLLLLVTLVLIPLSACLVQYQKGTIQEETRPYVNSFLNECYTYGVDCSKIGQVTVEIEELSDDELAGDGTTLAICTMYITAGMFLPTMIKTVRISPEFWYDADEDSRLSVVYHELGHCVLDRAHNDDMIDNETPASIMNTFLGDYPAYYFSPENKDYYMRELFQVEEN